MLTIKNLTIIQNKNQRELLKDCTFTVLPKEKIGIIGEEGNGKSTLLKIIYNSESVKDYCTYTGAIQHDHLIFGMLPQFLDKKWTDTLIWDFLFKKEPEMEPDYQNITELYPLLTVYSFQEEDLHQKKCSKLSGGEQVKIQLIKLQMQHPDIYLLDEPTNDLDLETLILLENFIQEEEKTVLFISHDETLLRNVSTGILHLEQTHRKTKSRWTFENIPYDEYIDKRDHLKSRQNQISAKQHAQFKAKMDRYNRLYQKVDHALNTVSRQDPATGKLLKKKMKSIKSLEKRMEHEQKNLTERFEGEEEINFFFSDCKIPASKKVLDFSLESLSINQKLLSRNLHLQLFGSQKAAIIGKNGCGKSTLLKEILRQNQDRYDIGYMPQNYEELMDPEISVLDFLCLNQNKDHITRVQTLLGSLKFTSDEMLQKCRECSQGQKAKLYLSKLMLENKTFLILDEPTRNLSPLSVPVLRKALINFQGAILCVSHDRSFLEEVIEKIYVLDTEGLHELTGD